MPWVRFISEANGDISYSFLSVEESNALNMTHESICHVECVSGRLIVVVELSQDLSVEKRIKRLEGCRDYYIEKYEAMQKGEVSNAFSDISEASSSQETRDCFDNIIKFFKNNTNLHP